MKREGSEVACILIVDLAADLLEVSALLPRRRKRIEITFRSEFLARAHVLAAWQHGSRAERSLTMEISPTASCGLPQ